MNATCDFTIIYSYNRSSETFHCGWKLTYRRADVSSAWALQDVNALPNESDALKAALYCIQARPPFPFISKYAIII